MRLIIKKFPPARSNHKSIYNRNVLRQLASDEFGVNFQLESVALGFLRMGTQAFLTQHIFLFLPWETGPGTRMGDGVCHLPHCHVLGAPCVFQLSFFLAWCILSVYLSIHPPIHLSACLSVYLSVYVSIHPSIHLPAYLSIYLYHLTVCALSRVQLFVVPWTVACQTPLSMGFPRQEYWSGLPFLPSGDLPNPSLLIAGKLFGTQPPGKPLSSVHLSSI